MREEEHSFKETITQLGSYTGNMLVAASPGMRIIKTVLAVMLCLIFDYFRGSATPHNAAIAAVVCLQPSLQATAVSAKNRTMGTLIAGLYAYLFLLLFTVKLGLEHDSIVYPILVALGLLPLMLLILRLGFKTGFAITSIVYLLICMGSAQNSPLAYTLNRVLDTLVGIAAALLVNWLPFLNRWGEKLDKAKEQAEADKRRARRRLRDELSGDEEE